jgi:hypothetical protein
MENACNGVNGYCIFISKILGYYFINFKQYYYYYWSLSLN